MATRVTLPAWSLRSRQEARHGQPSVIADVRKLYNPIPSMTTNTTTPPHPDTHELENLRTGQRLISQPLKMRQYADY